MDIKQVIIVVRSPDGAQRVVYNNKGEAIAGDEKKAKKLTGPESSLSITIRGQKGEGVQATISGEGKHVAGNAEAVMEALEDYPNEEIAALTALIYEDEDEDDEEETTPVEIPIVDRGGDSQNNPHTAPTNTDDSASTSGK